MFLCSVVIVILLLVLARCLRKFLNDTQIDLKELGQWAVVTGATDGIGKAFTLELAKKGINVFLVSRNRGKLEETSAQIEKYSGVSTKIFQMDFSDNDKRKVAELREEMRNMEIGILINNVGTAYPHPEYFHEIDKYHEDSFDQLINVNIRSAVNMTRCVLPGMLQRRKGLIVNVSSMLSEMPAPLQAMYGASKSFITKLSRDLDVEYRNKGVHVHVLNTGLVATKLSGASSDKWWPPAITPEDYAASALEEVTKRRISNGHILHTCGQLVIDNLPTSWVVEKMCFSFLDKNRKSMKKECPQCKLSKE